MWSCVKVKQIHFLRIKPFKFFWILQQNFELERVNCIIIDLLFITLQAKPFFEKVLLMGIIYYVQFAKYVFVWWFAVSVEFSDHRLLFIIICWRYFITFPWRNSLKKDNISRQKNNKKVKLLKIFIKLQRTMQKAKFLFWWLTVLKYFHLDPQKVPDFWEIIIFVFIFNIRRVFVCWLDWVMMEKTKMENRNGKA